MRAKPGQPKHSESIISFGLLAVLFIIGLWVLIRQSNVDMGRFGMSVSIHEVSPAKQGVSSKETAALDAFAPAGFEAIGQTQVYTAGNLYEKINGKADFYIDAGFVQLSAQRFINGSNENLWMELYVYDMGSIRNAFSVYSRQRRPDVPALPDVQFGYRTTNAFYFVRGAYYIELVGSAESEELTRAATEVTQKIRTSLAVEQDTRIAELSIFPVENLIPESLKLYLSDTFGFERLTNTFAGRYKLDGEIITAFFSKRPDLQDAQNIAQAYHSFLLESGCTSKATTNEALKNLKAKVIDSYGTTEIIFVTGPFVGGVHEADNQEAAEKLAEVLALKLSDMAEKKGD
jgi:hypothetical protein